VALAAGNALAREATVTVARVLDGDSVVLTDGREVRLIGINAPEFSKEGPPHPPLAEQAQNRLRELVLGKPVSLVTEQERHDRYSRLLAHLVVENRTGVEEALLREGLAWAIAIPPNVEWLPRLQAAEAQARTARRGVWAEPAYRARPASQLGARDTGFRRVTGTVTRVGQSAHTIYMDLGAALTIVIPRDDWRQWFRGDAKSWRGRRVEARGWITTRENRLRLRIRHPAMLTSAHSD